MSNLAYDTSLDGVDTSHQDISTMQALRPIPRISIQAFCETEGVAGPIERAGEDRRMARAHLKVHMGGIATAVEFYQTAPTPNLILLESRSEPKQ
jgi:pilus assembly protein CpaE